MVREAIGAMSMAVHYWRQMAAQNYFGSEYVMADPYKEGADMMNKLGTLQCVTRQFDDGLQSLYDSYELLDSTLENYRALRIASRKTILEGQIALAETLLNYGVCAVEEQEHLLSGLSGNLDEEEEEEDTYVDALEAKLNVIYRADPDGVRNIRRDAEEADPTIFDDLLRAVVGLARARTVFIKMGDVHNLEEYTKAAEVASEFLTRAKMHYVALRAKVMDHYLSKTRRRGEQ